MTESITYTRVHAATRFHGSVLYVCPTGWSGHVFELGGAAAAVWESLADTDQLAEIARSCGVSSDDVFLRAAVDLLADSGLVHTVGGT